MVTQNRTRLSLVVTIKVLFFYSLFVTNMRRKIMKMCAAEMILVELCLFDFYSILVVASIIALSAQLISPHWIDRIPSKLLRGMFVTSSQRQERPLIAQKATTLEVNVGIILDLGLCTGQTIMFISRRLTIEGLEFTIVNFKT
ncbi:hypothetical protein Leryth_005465 [Lithospermum erythrorhizon]|nr:hypothetical protein Leryth_005465 [Lithospermum erythrorhizon]